MNYTECIILSRQTYCMIIELCCLCIATNIIEANYQLFVTNILKKMNLSIIIIRGKNMTFILILFTLKQEKTIKYKGSKLWNAWPIDMKKISSKYLFKKKVKDYLLQFLE